MPCCFTARQRKAFTNGRSIKQLRAPKERAAREVGHLDESHLLPSLWRVGVEVACTLLEQSRAHSQWRADLSALRLEYYVTIAGLSTRTPQLLATRCSGSNTCLPAQDPACRIPHGRGSIQAGKGTIGVAVGRPLLSVAEDHHPRDAAADCCHGVVERHCYEATVVDHSRRPGYLQRSSWSSCNATVPE